MHMTAIHVRPPMLLHGAPLAAGVPTARVCASVGMWTEEILGLEVE